MTGSLSVSSSKEDAAFARKLGALMGICFQIRDDIFDYYDDGEIGKPTHQDMIEGKLTLPALYVLNNSNEQWVHDVAVNIKKGSASLEEINRFVEYIRENKGIDYAFKRMNEFYKQAFDMLSSLPESEIRSSLISYLDYIVNRD